MTTGSGANRVLRVVAAAAGAGTIACASLPTAALTPAAPTDASNQGAAGPQRGSLVLAGGGRLPAEITSRFVRLAGGADARIVIIPTAGPYYFLRAGDIFDLATRRTASGTPIPPDLVRDETAVVAAMNALFDAMRSQDTAAIRQLAHPDLRLFVPGDRAGAPTLRVSTIDDFIHQVGASTVLLDERAYRPEVRIDHNLATIWTYYEFRRDDEFSHCGHDAFHFARTADGWKIIGLAYTIRQQCN